MKQCHKRLIFSWTTAGWLCLFVASCTTATVDESTGNAQPADAPTTGSAPGEEQADAKPTDIIDRMFSPLDNAVTDINRDLNKGDADVPSEPNE
jgi:hypothetical protein